LSITNTITHRKKVGDAQARRTAVAYYIQNSEIDRHKTLAGNSMREAWVPLPNSDQLRYTTTVKSSIFFPLGEAGLNQPAGNIYLTEAYALPYRGCWSVFGSGNYDCNWSYIKGSTHIVIGSELLFDILPATIEEFVDV